MRARQSGFNLIELIVVIVLIGILGVTATARYQDLTQAASDAVAQGIASEITAGSTMNYAVRITNPALGISVGNGFACSSANLQQFLQAGAWPDANVTVAGGPTACGAVGTADTSCVLSHTNGTVGNSATVTLTCTAP